MKRIILTLLVLIAPALCAQTTPAWFKVAVDAQYIAIPAGTPVTLRFGTATGTTSTGVDCSIGGCWNVITPSLPLAATFIDCCFLGTEVAPGLVKEIDILETAVPQSVSVMNGTAWITVVVPALTVPNYPPVTFVPGVGYAITVSNIPPIAPNSPLQALVKMEYGTRIVGIWVCTYGTTIVTNDTPQALAALFNCVAQSVPASLVSI